MEEMRNKGKNGGNKCHIKMTFFFFFERVSVYGDTAQTGFQFTEVHLPLPPKC